MRQYALGGMVLGNDNKPVELNRYIKELRGSQRKRDCYAINAQFWLEKYKKLFSDENERTLFLQKYFQMLKVASFFSGEDYPELKQVLKQFEDFLHLQGIAVE